MKRNGQMQRSGVPVAMKGVPRPKHSKFPMKRFRKTVNAVIESAFHRGMQIGAADAEMTARKHLNMVTRY